jgi:hypothetical protein
MQNADGIRATDADSLSEIETALCRAESEVARMDPSFEQRRLRQLLSIVWRSKATWSVSPPSRQQLEFLCRIVEGVLREASHEVPTERLRALSMSTMRAWSEASERTRR